MYSNHHGMPGSSAEPSPTKYGFAVRDGTVGVSFVPAAGHSALLADTLYTLGLPYHGDAIENGLRSIQGTPSLVPSWTKPVSTDTWILRLQETCGRAGWAVLRLTPGWTATTVGLTETPAAHATWHTGEFSVPATPYQVVSVMMKRA